MIPLSHTIEVKLGRDGRYTWKIIVNFENYKEGVQLSKQIDSELKDKFPDHVLRSSGRVANIEEDGE